MNLSDTIDVAHGPLTLQGQIADKSFLLLDDRGFPVSIWFDLRPQPGKRRISISRWHPAFIPPAHYPLPSPLMGNSWSYKEHLSLTEIAYTAVTPDALMGGIAVYAADRLGKLEASFDFCAELVLNMHPLCFNSRIEISANLSYEIEVRPVDKWPMCFQAELHISSPPLGGVVNFN
ncbi:hypothetical protein DER46DRAFT_697873 [Fusarium sp. MPI-SDFR-AT-0072]|nr:hypothetical protein DER46DRAFT_697873 [Fusarium sp. MPI-SDFR-AT-0072]